MLTDHFVQARRTDCAIVSTAAHLAETLEIDAINIDDLRRAAERFVQDGAACVAAIEATARRLSMHVEHVDETCPVCGSNRCPDAVPIHSLFPLQAVLGG
jgi:hypothetical protein